MPRHPDPSPPDRPYSRALPFLRRASQRRIEVFSPKLGRRLSLSSYGAWQLWLALEANPMVSDFCASIATRLRAYWCRSRQRELDAMGSPNVYGKVTKMG